MMTRRFPILIFCIRRLSDEHKDLGTRRKLKFALRNREIIDSAATQVLENKADLEYGSWEGIIQLILDHLDEIVEAIIKIVSLFLGTMSGSGCMVILCGSVQTELEQEEWSNVDEGGS